MERALATAAHPITKDSLTLAAGLPVPRHTPSARTPGGPATRSVSASALLLPSLGSGSPSAPHLCLSRARSLGPASPQPRPPRDRDPAFRSHAPGPRQPGPHSPSCGAASLPLLPPDGSRAAPSRASAPAGRAASRPAAATSSKSRRWLTVKFLRAWAQSPGPSAEGGGGPGPSAGLSRAKAAAALSMPASRPGVAGRVAGGVAASAARRPALCSAPAASWLRGRPARPALTSGEPTFLPPLLCLLALSQVAKT